MYAARLVRLRHRTFPVRLFCGAAAAAPAASQPKLPVVELFTHPGCCLCHPVDFVIKRVQTRIPFEYRVVNIHDPANAAAFEMYQYDIPVVALDGKEIGRHKLTEQTLVDALSAV